MSTTFRELSDAIAEEGEVPCHSAPDIFFADDETEGYVTLLRYAREMCESCPLMAMCLDYAVENYERFGIWGGTSPRTRQTMRRERGIPEYAEELESLVS